MDYSTNLFGDINHEGRVLHLTDQADFTSRLMGYKPYHEASDGDEYQFEMSAPAKDDDGNSYVVYWIFWDVRGQEKDLDEFDYDNIDRVEGI
jgi:hypothetical protein